MTWKTQPGRWERVLWPLVLTGALVALWTTALHSTLHSGFPTPAEILFALIHLASRGVLWRCTVASLSRVVVGFMAAVAMGLPLGLLLGLSKSLRNTSNPLIQILRPISPIAWIPVAIVLFGVGDRTAVFLILLSSIFPIIIATTEGVLGTPRSLREVAINFGLSRPRMVLTVLLPAALPQILVGLRIALGISWLVDVAAEMIAVDSGLGSLIIDARNTGKSYDRILATMIVIGLIGLVLDNAFRTLGRVGALRWSFREQD